MITHILLDGKYQVTNDNGILHVLRNGEPWPGKERDLVGDGFVLALVQYLDARVEASNELPLKDKEPWHCFQCGEALKEIGMGALACPRCDAEYIPSVNGGNSQCMVQYAEGKWREE